MVIGGVAWTATEDATLRASYPVGGIDAAARALPHRSPASIFHRAARLGMQRRRRWTARDDARLRRMWTGEMALGDIARALSRTECTTYWRAAKIGLPLGLADGWEYLHHAARRTGFGAGQLFRILAAAGVTVRPVLARPGARDGGRGYRMVWPADVDAAVADWLQRDTVERIAKRNGVARETLSRRLRGLGLQKPGGKRHWRITDEQAAQALGARLVRTRARGRYTGAHYAEATP